jgi:hypothetical protein
MRWVAPAAVVALVVAFSYWGPIPILRSHLVDTTYLVTHKATGGGEVPVTGVGSTACPPVTTGSTGNRATFGFNAKATSATTFQGELDFIDHTSGVTIHGDSLNSFNECTNDVAASFAGSYVVKKGSATCTGSGSFTVSVQAGGKGSGIFAVTFGPPSGNCSSENTSATITKGNITVH